MEIKITVTPKEIADLVREVQSQPLIKTTIGLDGKEISEVCIGNLVKEYRQSNNPRNLCR